MRGPGEKWTEDYPASSTKMDVLIGEPGLPLLGKAYADGESDMFATCGNGLDSSRKRATYHGDSECPEHQDHWAISEASSYLQYCLLPAEHIFQWPAEAVERKIFVGQTLARHVSSVEIACLEGGKEEIGMLGTTDTLL